MWTGLVDFIHHYFSVSISDGEKIAALFKPEPVAKNDRLLTAGRYCNQLSFIDRGLFRIFTTLPDREVTQWIATPNYFLTDVSGFFFRQPARWNLQALTNGHLYTISYADYQRLAQLIPKWNELEKLFISRCFVTLENRVFNLISLSAKERYQLLFEQQCELFTQVPLQYLASMLGMTPETFSRIRRKMLS